MIDGEARRHHVCADGTARSCRTSAVISRRPRLVDHHHHNSATDYLTCRVLMTPKESLVCAFQVNNHGEDRESCNSFSRSVKDSNSARPS